MERARVAKLRESLIMTVLALVALVALEVGGVDAHVPIPLLVGAVVAAITLASVAQFAGRFSEMLPLSVRVGMQVAGTTGVIYLTGWGPVLSVGYVFCAAEGVALEGSQAVLPVTIWMLVCLTVAQAGVAL